MSSRTSPSTSSLVLMPGTESKSDSSRDRQFSESTHKSQYSSSNSDPCNNKIKDMHYMHQIVNTMCDRSRPEKPELLNFTSHQVEGSNLKSERTAENITNISANLFASPYSTYSNKSKINNNNDSNNYKEENNNIYNNNMTNMSCSTSLALNTTVPSSSITLLEETNINNKTITTTDTTKSSSSSEVTIKSSEINSSAITTSPESFLSSIVAFHSETTTPELNRYVQELTTYSHSPCSSHQE